MEALFILLLALVVDLALGEPTTVIHPVVWMGKVVSFAFLSKGPQPHSLCCYRCRDSQNQLFLKRATACGPKS